MCVVLIEIDSTLGNINVSWFVTSVFKLSIIQAQKLHRDTNWEEVKVNTLQMKNIYQVMETGSRHEVMMMMRLHKDLENIERDSIRKLERLPVVQIAEAPGCRARRSMGSAPRSWLLTVSSISTSCPHAFNPWTQVKVPGNIHNPAQGTWEAGERKVTGEKSWIWEHWRNGIS